MRRTLLEIEDLHVSFGQTEAIKGLSLSIAENETLALVGESGSGKSASALAVLRLVERAGGRITRGRIWLHGEEKRELTALTDREMQRVRGREIAMVFQEPLTALNPVLTIGRQLQETIRQHEKADGKTARNRATELLEWVQLPNPPAHLSQYPHELSGGQRQRVMIAIALACRPRLLIADEPSTALDVTTQAEILALIRRLQAETGMSVLFITHDMGVVAEMAQRVAVLNKGRLVEFGDRARLLGNPTEPYTRMLLSAVPRLGAGAPAPLSPRPPVLELENVSVRYPARREHLLARGREPVRAVENVSLSIAEGETLGLVGESGCGKSTLARAILRLVPLRTGSIRVTGRDIAILNREAMMAVRRDVQVVFQDPFASLNPRLPVWFQVSEPAAIHKTVLASQRRDLAAHLLELVGLETGHLDRYPHQFSGGQRQRLCIARALSLDPKLIIADEPIAALDVSIAKQVTDLLQDLQARLGVSYLFISHDLAVVERMSHRVAIMKTGEIVESGLARDIIDRPGHSYTRNLLASAAGSSVVADALRRTA